MRKTVIGLATATAFCATPALADDGQVYVGVEGGVVLVEDLDFEVNDTGNIVAIDSKEGWEGGAFVGYDFGPVRAELEGSYKNFNIDTVDTGALGLGFFEDVAGQGEVWAGMVNALLDFGGNDGEVGFSVGGGVGIANTRFEEIAVLSTGTFLDDSDARFAWQAVAQLRGALTENIDAGLKYKYFNVDSVEVVDNLGNDHQFDLSTHSLLGSLIFSFGGAEPPLPPLPPVTAPPPPPLPPPAPPPPPRVSCNTGPYIVFFDWDSAEVTPEAATVLNSAITAYGNCGTVPIMLAGYTDRSGTVQYNLGLAARRNNSVQQYLGGRGIPAARISSEAFGEANPRVPTADGVRELQNRRVEITYGPGSGM